MDWVDVWIELRRDETHDDFFRTTQEVGERPCAWRYKKGTGLFDAEFWIELENADQAILLKLSRQ